MEQKEKEVEKGELAFDQLRKLSEEALAHLVTLKSDPNNRIALLGLLHAIQGIRTAADMLSLKGIVDYSGEAERLLATLIDGKITITEEIVFCIYDSVEILSKMIANW